MTNNNYNCYCIRSFSLILNVSERNTKGILIMKLTEKQILGLEKIMTMVEKGRSNREIASEMGLGFSHSSEVRVSSFFTMLRKVGIEAPRGSSEVKIIMNREELSQYEKWRELQAMNNT